MSGANFRLAERIADKKDCTWYGEAYCHGDEVIVSHVIFSSLVVLVFGSDRSSVNANLRPSVRSVKTCLELSIFIFLSQVSLRSVSGQSQVSLRSVSGQSQVSLRSFSGHSQVILRSVLGQS